jgi:hypothetical protein
MSQGEQPGDGSSRTTMPQTTMQTMHLLPYQVDYHNQASGKRLAATKRRIVWRFGFTNAAAIAEKQTGNNCRGEEHEVSVVWSLTSGKRQVTFDGKEVSFGKSTEAKLELSWTIKDGHHIKVIGHATPPLVRATPSNFRQFDFILDGLSFFDMPKIYELGTQPALASSSRGRGGGGDAVRSAGRGSLHGGSNNHYSSHGQGSSYSRRHGEQDDCDYDQRSFASAPLPSVTPEKPIAAAAPDRPSASPPTRAASMPAVVAAVETVDLLGGMNTSPAVPQQHQPQQQPQRAYPTAAAPVVAALPQPHHVAATYPQNNGYHHPQIQQHQHQQQNSPAYYNHHQQQQQQFQPQYAAAHHSRGGVNDEFAPVPPPPRTFQDVSKQILSNYGPDPNAPLALANAPHYDDHVYENSTSDSALIADDAPRHVTPEKQGPLTLRPTMEPVSIAELEAREHVDQYCMSDLERAMKSMVNLDDITETVETPEQAKQRRLKAANQPTGRSKPKPAATPAWNLGLSPALQDIKDHTTPKSSSQPTRREIMRNSNVHAFDPATAQAGMMVMYGASSSAGAVATPPPPPPPPHSPPFQNGIPLVQGFGAGVHASHHNSSNMYAY